MEIEVDSPTFSIAIAFPFVRSNPKKGEDARGFEFRVSGWAVWDCKHSSFVRPPNKRKVVYRSNKRAVSKM
jgi:hypothetical protein